jgi:hypothetical protein
MEKYNRNMLTAVACGVIGYFRTDGDNRLQLKFRELKVKKDFGSQK